MTAEETPEEQIESIRVALDYIRLFRDGTGIDWNSVETVFDVVEPLLREKLEALKAEAKP